LYTIERPLKNTYALTFAPSSKNLMACFSLKLKSWSSVFGPNLISFTTVLVALALISFCFLFCSYKYFL
jgi:putative effector of murein hydrolase LrgA (UPF0299 family)